MNVQVKHNSVDITNYVISWDREHKICTGIGQLTITVAQDVNRTFVPWDTIDIYENGSYQCRYYVSTVTEEIPSATITIDAQDNSKRLVDYFIPDTYIIDYPSYTRYWIEYFLDEVGVTYSFNTSEQGSLLSNYTQLGLTSCYEQLITLLQQSGWYMYFDGNGVANIGTLDTDLATKAGKLTRSEIITIKKVEHDKMLRNRALVLGAFDPLYNAMATAEISVQTPWNYDQYDLRTVVISNSNIPNSSTAYGMATQIINEFARITVEKHITSPGALTFSLGDYIEVNSNVYTGNGLITTFGTSLSKEGLVTNLILDERCPRLFGFFDFGDYVYVGTFGDGVWRKHIRFDNTFYNFSSGLEDLGVTDLHINNGLFSCVTSGGSMYYTINELPWKPLVIESLESSLYDNLDSVASGVGSGVYIPMTFSGIMARATIIDKITNRLVYGVDNFSGGNFGDYFIGFSGYVASSPSGIMVGDVTISGYRGWVVEYDLADGFSSYNSYPIHISGNYDITVIDIENDGTHDYVSVAERGGAPTIPYNEFGYNFGRHISWEMTEANDQNNLVSYANNSLFEDEGKSYSFATTTTALLACTAIFNNETINEREVVTIESSTFKRRSLTKQWSEILMSTEITSTTLTSPSFSATGDSSMCIEKLDVDNYRFYETKQTEDASNRYITVYYFDWDADGNTVSAEGTAATLTIPKDTVKETTSAKFAWEYLTNGTTIYIYATYIGYIKGSGASTTSATNWVRVYALQIDTMTGTAIVNGIVCNQSYNTADGTFGGHDWNIQGLPNSFPPEKMLFQWGDGVAYAFFIKEWNQLIAADADELNNYLIYSNNGTTFHSTLVQSTDDSTDSGFLLTSGTGETARGMTQLSGSAFIVYHRRTSGTSLGMCYLYNGSTVAVSNVGSDVPWYWKNSNIYPLYVGTETNYIGLNGSTYYYCNGHTISLINTFTFPAYYNISYPFSAQGSVLPLCFWLAYNTDTFEWVFLRTTTSTFVSQINPYAASAFTKSYGHMAGNFWIDGKGENVLYLDNVLDVPNSSAISFHVLQRDNDLFHIIRSDSYPIRTDISLSAPIVTVTSGSESFQSHFVYDDIILTVDPTTYSGIIADVQDFRYTLLDAYSGFSLLAAMESGIFRDDVSVMSGVQLLYDMPSGSIGRLETTNYAAAGQYIFATTLGANPSFFQKDPGEEFFTTYSGLPASRATIIRIDDRN